MRTLHLELPRPLETLLSLQRVRLIDRVPIIEEMLNGICADGRIFKSFEQDVEPLYQSSPQLRNVTKAADTLADKTKEESLDLARALLIEIPRQPSTRSR